MLSVNVVGYLMNFAEISSLFLPISRQGSLSLCHQLRHQPVRNIVLNSCLNLADLRSFAISADLYRFELYLRSESASFPSGKASSRAFTKLTSTSPACG